MKDSREISKEDRQAVLAEIKKDEGQTHNSNARHLHNPRYRPLPGGQPERLGQDDNTNGLIHTHRRIHLLGRRVQPGFRVRHAGDAQARNIRCHERKDIQPRRDDEIDKRGPVFLGKRAVKLAVLF